MMVEHVQGKNAGNVMLYALSTCGWCRKTRQLLDELGVAYDYEYVDLTTGERRTAVMDEVRRWNPVQTFPTIIVNGNVIIGFREDEIRRSLRND
jgi:glutaredoxin-like protein NrdH